MTRPSGEVCQEPFFIIIFLFWTKLSVRKKKKEEPSCLSNEKKSEAGRERERAGIEGAKSFVGVCVNINICYHVDAQRFS